MRHLSPPEDWPGAPASMLAPGAASVFSGTPPADTIDVADLVREVGRNWRAVLGGLLVGLVAAAAVVWLVPPRYAASTTVLLRNANDPAGSLLSRIGVAGDLAGAVGGGALGNALKSPLETELQLIKSRDILGQVVDSLGLQARVLSPRGVPSRALVAPTPHPGSFKRVRVAFTRSAGGAYEVSGAGVTVRAVPGGTVTLPKLGAVTLTFGPLPDRFIVQFEDREDAITRADDRLSVEKKGGELAELAYSGPDSLTAATVPNAIAAAYLDRRRTVDRGLNQRRYEFLTAQIDSVQGQLGPAEESLRLQQEGSGVFDPELAGRSGMEAVQDLRKELVPAEAERQAARQLLDRVDAGVFSARQIAAFPAFLKSPAINTILGQIATLETERTNLLERRTPRDPEVVALSKSIANLERQLEPLGRSYAAALDRQTDELRRQERQLQSRLTALPRDAEGNLRRQRDVRRLTQTLLGLQAQVIDVRLAAVAEGGQVRVVDTAVPPKKIRFPRPLPTFAVAALLGLLGGVVWAAAGGALSARVRTLADAERAGGVPALAYRAGAPLLLGTGARTGTVVVASVGAGGADAAAVARQLQRLAIERGRSAVRVDLLAGDRESGAARHAVASAEGAHDLVVVSVAAYDDLAAAAILEPPRVIVLVARARRTRRADLAVAVDALTRLGVVCVGIVVTDEATSGVASAEAARDARVNGAASSRPPVLSDGAGDGLVAAGGAERG